VNRDYESAINRIAKQRYVRVAYNGSSFIVPAGQAKAVIDDLLDGDDPEVYEINDVWLTPREYESLPEFAGF
jgi:hypothetical protein